MSDSKDDRDDQDPDYATPGPSDGTHQKLYEETARTNVARKITAIVEKEFSKEIETKEKEIIQIEGKLHKALKTLHFLRYVIITDFYNRKQCQIAQSVGESKQGQIHPAVKQIIGKAPRMTENLFSSLDDSRTPSTSKLPLSDKETTKNEIQKRLGNTEEISNECSVKNSANGKRSAPHENSSEYTDDGPPKKIPRYVPPKSGIPEPQVPSRGARHKVRKRIVVGNISKWILPDWREDTASHKWTMYVRGSKENADIADFVSKIRFFLHPSYRPNDVVEVTSPPFHLSRRGWGEFPLRVQLHFKNPLNKPMDIIHYLKLDRTYTGLQTLGSETVVDVWIKTSPDSSFICDNKNESTKNNQSIADFTATIKQEPIHDEKMNENSMQETPCLKKIKSEPDNQESSSHIFLEHDYANFPYANWTGRDKNFPADENNVTISHSPGSTKNIDELSELTKINGEKTYDEIVSNFEDKATDIQASRILNGKCGITQEFTTIPNKGNSEIKMEVCDSFTPEVEPTKSSNVRSDVKTMASNLDNSSPKLQPLKIAIPAAFEALKRSANTSQKLTKQILVLQDGKLIPMNSVNSARATTGSVATIVSGISCVNVPKSGTSLLKKQPIGKSTKMLFKLNSTNSLILNNTSNIPALKMVEPTELNKQRLYIVEKKLPHRTTVGILSNTKNNFKEPTEHWLDNHKVPTKSKITVGKDRIKATSKRDSYEEILRTIDDVEITDVSALVRFIIQRLPLITERATDLEYRNLHPYASSSEIEFLNSNIGKQRALEWYRAKHIKSFLKKKGIPEELQWTIKEIMIWARLHGHTPISSVPNVAVRSRGHKSSDKNFPGDTSETSPCTFTEPSGLLEFLRTAKECKVPPAIANQREDEVEVVDVENIICPVKNENRDKRETEGRDNKGIISLGIPEKMVALQSYVCDTARQIGIKLGPEEIVPGVMHCAPARMMVKAVQCLLEDLLRSSLAKAWERSTDGSCPDMITLEDVRGAILNRETFDVFTNEGLGSHQCPDD